MDLGNYLGSYLDAYMSFIDLGEMALARIVVSLNLREGLLGELNLISGEKSLKQFLDYEGVPFRCRRNHQYVHIQNECTLSFQGKTGGSQYSIWNKRTTTQRDNSSSNSVGGRGNS